jgi:hypothetical protein
MTLLAAVLVVLFIAALVGTALAHTMRVVRGDGQVGPGQASPPPRSHHADHFEPAIRRLL